MRAPGAAVVAICFAVVILDGGILGPYAVGLLIGAGVAFQWNFWFFVAFALLAMLLVLALGRHPDERDPATRPVAPESARG
ncbi:hypothetical protein GCM10010472_04640 [Pseudonocardia halophobica]|uniref:Major facilitator superfamily (MFS) profile domain-containing protein n=1 Tax=Pseudonocardia halophobica TaxID=29401 RepID=A0A9W6NY54_9PSEU|nr:hypothetical protein [Pseudonocardia halophobica]GLL13423.1 hypothetical protein GCM10017577_45660 [Pseudonocardia halophobica]